MLNLLRENDSNKYEKWAKKRSNRQKDAKKSKTKKPERTVSQTKCKYGCVYSEKNFADNFGD